MLEERSGLALRDEDRQADLAAKETTRKLLQQPIGADEAVKLAFLNNAGLRAKLEEAGIARADLVQTGLLENPRLHASLRFPSGGGADHVGRELGVTIDFLDAMALPLRRKLGEAQYEQAKFRLSHDVLGLATEIKETFYALQAAEQRLAMRRSAYETMEAAAKLSTGQRAAGNISELDAARQQAASQEASLDFTKEEAEVAKDRERLALLIGAQDIGDWKVSETLPNPPASDPALGELETAAANQRWDLAAARKEPTVLKEALHVSRLRMLGGLNAGFDSERDLDGKLGVGPAIEWNIPLFDRQQAQTARIKAQSRQSEYSIEALESQIRYEVRSARAALVAARKAVDSYRDNLVPLREKISGESLKHYNFMLLGVYQLLQAKREELDARRGYVDALKDYWTSWAELERAVGGKMPTAKGEKP
ncbi:MAG: TolC family protein [Elusimicrobia bacterium]|nr:TolC family protein [Elusimicrobiota bacterium]